MIWFSHIGSIGAFITVVSLALDPFFQQTIKYEGQLAIDLRQDAHVVASYNYNATGGPMNTFDLSCEFTYY
jgi:hypothetical protein